MNLQSGITWVGKSRVDLNEIPRDGTWMESSISHPTSMTVFGIRPVYMSFHTMGLQRLFFFFYLILFLFISMDGTGRCGGGRDWEIGGNLN